MNRQETYNRVRNHLLAQMKHATDPVTHNCRYRTPEGLACAIGSLIPDDKYSPEMEEMSVDVLCGNSRMSSVLATEKIEEHKRLFGVESDADICFLGDLQTVHDCNEPEHWQQRLTEVANRWRLTNPAK